MTAFSDDPVLARLTEQTDLLLQSARAITDSNARGPSLLPGWSRAHVLSHVARNADGLANVARSASTGVPATMYASTEARDADIEAGSTRNAAELEADVESSAERLLGALAEVPENGLDVECPSGRGPTIRVGDVPWLRVREVVYHHVDLDVGFTFAHVPDAVLRAGLQEALDRLTEASPGVTLTCTFADGSTRGLVIGDGAVPATAPAHAALAWLTGRSEGADVRSGDPAHTLPSLPSWG